MAGATELSNLLTSTEFSALDGAIKDKIQQQLTQLNTEIEESKAKFEKHKVNSEQQYSEIESQLINSNAKLETESTEKTEYKTKLDEIEKKYEEASSKLKTYQSQEDGNLSTQLKLSKANEQLEFEKRDFALLLEKRDREINNMNDELKEMSKKAGQMNNEKCEAVAKLDEIRSLEINKEIKRLEQEKENLLLQIDLLNKDVNEKMKQLMDTKREKSSSMLEMQSQLEERTEECGLLKATLESLRKTNSDQQTQIDNLIEKIRNIQDSNVQSEEQFQQEIQARVRLVDLYKNAAEEAESKSSELSGAVTELQKLLKEAAEAHTDMENEKNNEIQDLKDEIETREDRVRDLNQELENANVMIDTIKSTGMSEEKMETLFPSAAATSKMLKSGMSLTQIYNEYVKVTDALQFEKGENKRLNTYLDQILQEIEEKAPMLKKQREDYDVALRSIDQMTRQLDSAMLERQNLRGESDECHRKANHLTKENIKQQQQIKDLSDQVRYLVKEIEELRGGRVVRDEDVSSLEVTSSSNAITENLVTFRNIEELQEQNSKLLVVIRELSEKREIEESTAIQSKTKEVQDQLELTKEQLEKMQDVRQKEKEMLESMTSQRDMYRVLLQQANSTPEVMPQLQMSAFSPALSSTIKSPEKNKSSDETTKALKQLQETFTTYKKEKFENDKIMTEQMEKVRKESSHLRIQNAKLASQLEFASEKYKVLQGNAESYRKEIAAKTEKIQKYSTSITKHEMTVSTLREDAMSKQEQLAQAQSRLENMRMEKDILKSSEQRLAAEQESLRREIRTQSQLMGNLQAIQINLERNEQDTKFRLGKKIETLEREKTYLRNKLETEEKQNEIGQKHYEHQIHEMRQRMESELANHQRTKDQNKTTHKQLYDIKQQLVITTQKLHAAESRAAHVPDNETVSERSANEVKDLKLQLEQNNLEIQSLTDQLQKAKQHVEQYKTIADSVQQTIQEQNETSISFKESLEEKLNDTVAERDQLKERVENLEKERQDLLTENFKVIEESHNMNAELRKQLTSVQTELQEAIAKRESAISLEEEARKNNQEQVKIAREAQDKYERELILHAGNVEALTAMKERLASYDDKIGEKEEEIRILKRKMDDAKASFENRESMLIKTRDRLSDRAKTLETENVTLQSQMGKLSSQVVSVQEKVVEASKLKTREAFQRSTATLSKDDSGKSSEQLLEVIRYLRREKEIAEGKVDVVETESSRMKQKCESLEKQLETLNTQIAEERQKLQTEMNTAAQHAELMHKVENYNILLDSNKMLREEKNQLQVKVTQTEAKLNALEEKITPLQEDFRNTQAQKEAAQNDSKAAFAEVDRWRTRTNQLIEQSHKTDPEEHKRLLQEREELKKQLMSLQDELHQAKTEVSKSNQECTKLRAELNKSNQECTKLQRLLTTQKEESIIISEELDGLKEKSEAKDKEVEERAKTIVQLRKIGRKYKDQAENITKEFEEFKANAEKENAQSLKQANEEQIKTLREKLREAESEKEMKVKESEEKKNQLEQNVKEMEAKKAVLETSLKESEMKRADLEQKLLAVRTEKDQLEADSGKRVNQEINKVKEETQKVKEELKKTIDDITKEKTKLVDEKSDLEKKLARTGSVLQTAKTKLQSLKEGNEKLSAERDEMRKKIASYEQTSTEESDLKMASMKSMFENQTHKLEEELNAAKKENAELQTKIQQLQKQVEELQKLGAPSVPAHTSRSASAVSSDRTSSSPSEPPKTANIRPIASSPAAIKPHTVPVQPQSAASRVTASIRPMAIAPTSVPPMSSSSGTPTATVMPTTVTPQESSAEGETVTPVQQLFPQPSGGSGTRPTQQVQRVIPTQENPQSSESETGVVEPQPSSSRDTSLSSIQQTNKRQRDDLESPGTSDDALQKRQKVASPDESQEIPEITVTDENAMTTPVASQQDIERHTDVEVAIDEPQSVENIFEMESQDYTDTDPDPRQTEEEDDGGDNVDDDDDDPVIIVESDEGGQDEEEYEEEDEEEEEEEGDEEEEEGEEEEDYEGDENQEQDEGQGGEEGNDIYYLETQEMGGVMQGSGSQSNQEEMHEGENDDVVIIDEGDDEPPVSQSSSQPGSQSSSQTLVQPILAPERQLSVGSRNQLTPFMIGANPYEELDDCTVPSTPTLNVPRRGDGFAEAVSSPQVSLRFVFGSGGEHNLPGFPQLDTQTGMGMDDTRMDLTQLEDGSGRSVPSTPLHTTAPITVISESADVLSRQSELNVGSQSEIDINIEEETGEGQLEEIDGEHEEEDLEGEQGEDDSQEDELIDKEQPGTSETAEASSSQDDNTDKSLDANKPKIQKIVWDTVPPTQPPSNPLMATTAIQSLSQPQQYRPPQRGTHQRGAQSARRSFSRGGPARRSMRGRGNFTRRPPMY